MKNTHRIIGLCLYFSSSFAIACSCAYSTLSEKVNLSDNIFIVETYQIETIEKANPENYSGGKRHAQFKVLETLKGTPSAATFISSAEEPVCCICQSQVQNNTKYLVFDNGGGSINLGSCGFTQAISNSSEISDTIKAMVQAHKPTEIFTGIYISDRRIFLNDDGSVTEVLELVRKDYYAPMSRITLEGIKLPSGKLLLINLNEEQTLSGAEIAVIEERRKKKKPNTRNR